MTTGPQKQMTGRAGEHYVAGELNRRGAYAVTFAGNMPRIDIIASNEDGSRVVQIQVKTSRAGDWHTSSDEGGKTPCKDHFWILVRLPKEVAEPPVYYVVPDKEMRKRIKDDHDAYLLRHGGKRARNPSSKHHAIRPAHVAEFQGRWDLLKLALA